MAQIGSLVDRRDPVVEAPPELELELPQADVELDGPAWEGAGKWTCRCGYVNAGFDRCPSCGARRSLTDGGPERRPGAVSPSEGWERPAATPAVPLRRRRIDSKVARTVGGIILLNVVIQVFTASLAVQSGAETGDAIRLSLFSGLVFFAFAALWVLGRSTVLGVRPVLRSGSALAGAGEGAVVGGGLAIVFTAVAYVASGHPVVDPVAGLLASETVGPLLIGGFILIVAAPVVEELVFRGFLAEALRGRGRRVAGLLSAAAFSIAHLRFEQFRYYVGMGLVLFYLYWRRGLSGSIAAHAAFNGMLFVAALAVAHGPALTLTDSGATVTLPGRWQPADVGIDADIAAIGPAGAWFGLGHQDIDATGVEPEHFAQNLRTGVLVLPSAIAIDPDTISVIDLPAGRAVSFDAEVEGHEGRMVALLRNDRLWWLTLTTAGSSRASGDFNDALLSLQLP
ncbi:MAG TPA: type II CAAX endopeptidase family protein [Acidimicrobiales bacterium]|nr:type II CAAX endopeptidase family protein [Acidimicrobiales bacterium]